MDNWDNGVYIIKNWDIIDRKFFNGVEQNSYDLIEMMLRIDDCQLPEDRLGKRKIRESFADSNLDDISGFEDALTDLGLNTISSTTESE